MNEQKFEWVLVETVDSFRMRYVVQVPKGKTEYALDDVVMHRPKEFSQKHLDEIIVSHRVISQDEGLKLCDEDNAYCQSWDTDKKVRVFFTHDGEKRDEDDWV